MVRRLLVVLILGAAALAQEAAPAKDADTTAFGFHLGKALSLPECRSSKIGRVYSYAISTAETCYQRVGGPAPKAPPVTNDTILIQFPAAAIPQLVSGTRISGQVVDGNLESIGFNTAGWADQDQALAGLKEKYGEPTTAADRVKQNANGARFDSHVAVWKFRNLTVVFQGTTSSIDSGLVNIDTTKGADFRAALMKKATDGPKL